MPVIHVKEDVRTVVVVFTLPTRCFWAFCAALEFAIHGDTFEDATAVVVMLDGEEKKSRDIWREKVTLNPEKKSAGDQLCCCCLRDDDDDDNHFNKSQSS